MNPPRLFVQIVGLPLVSVAILGAVGYMLYDWWITGAVWAFQPIAAFFILSFVARSFEARLRYKQWERRWISMRDGPAPPPQTTEAGLLFRMLLLFAILWAMGSYLYDRWDSMWLQLNWAFTTVLGLFSVVVFLLVARMILWIARRKPRRAKEPPVHIVLGCLPRAKKSPKVDDAIKALPAYCRPLLARRPAAPHILAAKSRSSQPTASR